MAGVEAAAVQCDPAPCFLDSVDIHDSPACFSSAGMSRNGRCTHCVSLQALAAQHRAIRQAAEAGAQPALAYLSSTGVYGDWDGDWVDER